jgi:hypothetical protein
MSAAAAIAGATTSDCTVCDGTMEKVNARDTMYPAPSRTSRGTPCALIIFLSSSFIALSSLGKAGADGSRVGICPLERERPALVGFNGIDAAALPAHPAREIILLHLFIAPAIKLSIQRSMDFIT